MAFDVTQTGNIVICGAQFGNNTGLTPSFTDDKGSTWTIDKRFNDSNQNYVIAHAFPSTGMHVVTFAISGAGSGFVQAGCGEYNNVSGIDACSVGNASSGTSITDAAVTTTQINDLMVNIVGLESSSAVVFTVGSQANITWTAQQNDGSYATSSNIGELIQWGQFTSSGSFTAVATVNTSISYGSVSCGYKTASAGSGRPAGIYISAVEHYNVVSCAQACTFPIPFDTADSCAIITAINATTGGTNAFLGSVTQSGTGSGNTWNKAGTELNSGGSGHMALFYSCGSFGGDSKITASVNGSGATWVQGDVVVYGVIGVSALDTAMTTSTGGTASCSTGGGNSNGFCIMTGSQGTNATTLTTYALTPGHANELIIIAMGVNSPQVRGCSSGCTTDTAYSPQEASASEMDENNGKAHNLVSSTSPFTVTWLTTSTAGVGGWQVVAAGFFLSAAGCSLAATGAGSC